MKEPISFEFCYSCGLPKDEWMTHGYWDHGSGREFCCRACMEGRDCECEHIVSY